MVLQQGLGIVRAQYLMINSAPLPDFERMDIALKKRGEIGYNI